MNNAVLIAALSLALTSSGALAGTDDPEIERMANEHREPVNPERSPAIIAPAIFEEEMSDKDVPTISELIPARVTEPGPLE